MWEVQIDGGLVDEFATFEEAKAKANEVLPEASENYCAVEIWHNGETVDWND
jgi:hypothetical protein